MTEFTLTQDFPASLARLWTVFGSADYVRAKYEAGGTAGAAGLRLQQFDATPQRIEVVLERDLELDPARLPLWARLATGRRLTLRQRSLWWRGHADDEESAGEGDGPDDGDGPGSEPMLSARLELSPRGLPIEARGRGRLSETRPGHTRMVLVWQVRSRLGAPVERLFASQIRQALEADHAFTLAYLRRAVAA